MYIIYMYICIIYIMYTIYMCFSVPNCYFGVYRASHHLFPLVAKLDILFEEKISMIRSVNFKFQLQIQ